MGLDDMKKTFDKYSGGAGASWFQLKDDGDSAIVRFLFRGEDDIDYTVVHQIEIDGSQRKVECLEYRGKDCPLCEAGEKNRARMFLQLLDYRDGEVKVWERGKTFLPEITTFVDNCSPVYTIRAKVTRHGERGDPQTQYKIIPLVNDDEKYSMEDNEENFEKIEEKRTEVFGSNNMVIRKGKDDLIKMANGTFSFQNDSKDNPMSSNSNSNNSNNTSNDSNGDNTDEPEDYF